MTEQSYPEPSAVNSQPQAVLNMKPQLDGELIELDQEDEILFTSFDPNLFYSALKGALERTPEPPPVI